MLMFTIVIGPFLMHAQAIVFQMGVAQRDLKGKEYRLWQ